MIKEMMIIYVLLEEVKYGNETMKINYEWKYVILPSTVQRQRASNDYWDVKVTERL